MVFPESLQKIWQIKLLLVVLPFGIYVIPNFQRVAQSCKAGLTSAERCLLVWLGCGRIATDELQRGSICKMMENWKCECVSYLTFHIPLGTRNSFWHSIFHYLTFDRTQIDMIWYTIYGIWYMIYDIMLFIRQLFLRRTRFPELHQSALSSEAPHWQLDHCQMEPRRRRGQEVAAFCAPKSAKKVCIRSTKSFWRCCKDLQEL